LVAAVTTSIIMQLAVIYLPVLQPIFKTTALVGWQWSLILVAAGGPSFMIGVIRFIRHTFYPNPQTAKL